MYVAVLNNFVIRPFIIPVSIDKSSYKTRN